MPKIRAEGQEYDLPAFTLGELRELKRDFGVEAVDEIRPNDPDHICGVLLIAMRRQRPDVTLADIEAISKIELIEDDAEEGSDPTPAGDPGDNAGSQGTTPPSSGTEGPTSSPDSAG